MNNSSKLFNVMVIVYMITNLIASTYLIAFQFDTLNQRAVASDERKQLKKQNDYIVCILQVQPEARTSETITKCHDNTVGYE